PLASVRLWPCRRRRTLASPQHAISRGASTPGRRLVAYSLSLRQPAATNISLNSRAPMGLSAFSQHLQLVGTAPAHAPRPLALNARYVWYPPPRADSCCVSQDFCTSTPGPVVPWVPRSWLAC